MGRRRRHAVRPTTRADEEPTAHTFHYRFGRTTNCWDKAPNKELLRVSLQIHLLLKWSCWTSGARYLPQQLKYASQSYLLQRVTRFDCCTSICRMNVIGIGLTTVLVIFSIHAGRCSSERDGRQGLEWCSSFPDEEARAECADSEGTFWMYSPTCCNVKWECVDGENNQGLRCSVSGFIPDSETMMCIDEPTCIDTSSTVAPTTTTTVRITTTTLEPTTVTTITAGETQFCDTFPMDEPPIYCAGTNGSFWMSSPSCCNVKFECLDGAYNQGFRCSSPGFVPDLQRLKCIEDSACDRKEEGPSEDTDGSSPDIICSNASAEYLPHPSDCSKYFLCNNGIVQQLECMDGSIFSYQSQRCLPGDKDTCELMGA